MLLTPYSKSPVISERPCRYRRKDDQIRLTLDWFINNYNKSRAVNNVGGICYGWGLSLGDSHGSAWTKSQKVKFGQCIA